MKRNLSLDGLKAFFLNHVEKMVFGVAILVVLLFIYLGYGLQSGLEGSGSAKTPDKLKDLATTAVAHIEQETAAALKEERTPREGEGGQYERRVVEVSTATDPSSYATTIPWLPPRAKPGTKREDPTILAPIKLEATALTGPIAVSPRSSDDNPVLDLKNSPAPEKKKKKKKKKRASRDPYGSSGEEDYEGGSEEYDPYSGDDSRKKKKKSDEPTGPERQYPASKVDGYRPGTVGGNDPYGGIGGAGAAPGAGTPGAGNPGAGSTGGGGSGSAGIGVGAGGDEMDDGGFGGGGGGAAAGPGSVSFGGPAIGRSQNLIAVKGLVPFRRQVDEFQAALGDAVGYDPIRDRPRLVFFQAQRADVTDDPTKELTDADWKDVMNPKTAERLKKTQRWHGVMSEVADRSFVDPSVTMPAPPIMLRDMEALMLHPDIPKRAQATYGSAVPGEDEGEEEGEDEMPEEGSDLPGGGLPGGRGGFAGSGGYPGSGGYAGSGGGFEGSSGYPGYGDGGEEEYGYDGEGYDEEEGGYGGFYGSGGYPGSAYGAAQEEVQYKLIRFFDTTIQPGKVYRYRIRLFIEDPNNPNTDPINGQVWVEPRRKTLSADVLQRIAKQDADETTKNAYYVISDWSDSTEPVSLPTSSRTYVGGVTAPRVTTGIGLTDVPQSEVRGSVVPVVWHQGLALDVSTEMKAYRGSFMRLKQQFDVLDPITLVVKILEDYEFKNDFLVLDIRGGEDLPGARTNRVTSIGEYLILDDTGNLIVHNELDDFEKARRYTFKDEMALRGAGDAFDYGGEMGGGDEYGSGSPYGSGYPGGPPGNPGGANN